jgi:hypothetical protein
MTDVTVLNNTLQRNAVHIRSHVHRLLGGLLVVMVAVLSTAQSQVIPPGFYEPIEDFWCWKARFCTGAALLGECEPHGFTCHAGTCGDPNVPNDGCSWIYKWACYESCEDTCMKVKRDEQSSNCGGSCVLLMYNQCACACSDLGTNERSCDYTYDGHVDADDIDFVLRKFHGPGA